MKEHGERRTHCRNPLCERALSPRNRTGWCYRCQGHGPLGEPRDGTFARWYRISMGVQDDWRARENGWKYRWRKARIAAGLCAYCPNPSPSGKQRCDKCRTKDISATRMRDAA